MIQRLVKSCRVPTLGLAFLAILLLPRVSSAAAKGIARLLIYVEVPRPVEAATEIEISGMSLLGQSQPVPLELKLQQLASNDLEGRQILLVSDDVAPGTYTTLHLEVSRIRGQVGVARVSPLPPPDGFSVTIDLRIAPASCEILFLQWRPAAIDAEAEFHVPDLRQQLVGVPPLESLAFVTSKSAGSVMLIDRLSNRVVGARRVDEDPRGLAYLRETRTLFVALAGQDAIGVVDGLSLRLVNAVPLQFGDDPTRLLLSNDRSTLFVLSPGSRTVTALSSRSLQQQFRVLVGEEPVSFALDPSTGFVYVACRGEGTVQVIDPRTGSLAGSITLAPAPGEVVIDPQSRRLFVGGSIQRRVHYLELGGNASGSQTLCGPISGLAYNPRTQRLYAGIPGCRGLAVVRPELELEFGSVDLPAVPGLMVFDQEFRQLLVVLPDAGVVAVCNPNRGLVEGLIQVGDQPFDVLVP